MDCVVLHYNEITLKGDNREFFERKLLQNVGKTIGEYTKKTYKLTGRMVSLLKKGVADEELGTVRERLELVPGIANFSFAEKTEPSLKRIEERVVNLVKKKVQEDSESFESFKIETKRSDKEFPKNSVEVNEHLGSVVVENFDLDVDLDSPDLTVFVELCRDEAFIYFEKVAGLDGLPMGSSGRVLASLSGGLDSPVAVHMASKRGCRVLLAHFKNQEQSGAGVESKVSSIAEELTRSLLTTKLYTVPFGEVQKSITMSVPSEYRMIIYRRFMMRILSELALRNDCSALITGDSIGQVASQTLENIQTIFEPAGLPVLTPLIGMNKVEVMETARRIGTYEHSIKPGEDCCSYMIADHPETESSLEKVEELERNIDDSDGLVERAVSQTEVKEFNIKDVHKEEVEKD